MSTVGLIRGTALDDLIAWLQEQPLEAITGSSYVAGRLEKWYQLGSNLQSIQSGKGKVFAADTPGERVIALGDKLLSGWNSILVCGGPTSIGWHRDHGHFEEEAVMVNVGETLFQELPRAFDIKKAKTATAAEGLTGANLITGQVVRLNIKQPHQSTQTSAVRFNLTFRKVKPQFLTNDLLPSPR